MWMGQTSMYMKKQMILVTLLLFLFFRENAKALRFDAKAFLLGLLGF
jgi:hypothetical protein